MRKPGFRIDSPRVFLLFRAVARDSEWFPAGELVLLGASYINSAISHFPPRGK